MRARFTIGPDQLDVGDHPDTKTFTRGKFRTVSEAERKQLELPDRQKEYGFEFDEGTEDDPQDAPESTPASA